MLYTTIIEVPQWHGATAIEIIWTATGLVTVLFVLWMLYIVTVGYRETPSETLEKEASMAYVRREVVRLIQGGLVLTVGLYITFWVDNPPHSFITLTGLLATISLFLLALLVVVQSFLDWRARVKIINEMHEKGIHF